MSKYNILWADDEIDLLKPHILFLENKGYQITTVTNGRDAIDLISEQNFDVVLLDENMPGINGIETLSQIKTLRSSLPVIMVTKSEEESIMEDAIGSKISDYLIKPVHPNQLLSTIKKNIDKKRLVSEKITSNYQQEFRNIGMTLSDNLNLFEWKDVYKKLVFWEMELEGLEDESMHEILQMQKKEANNLFSKYVEENYVSWINGKSNDKPIMSHTAFKEKISSELNTEDSVFLIMIDNLRYDQWKAIEPIVSEYFSVQKEELYMSILPTATQYARNAFFAGLMPSEIEKRFPEQWSNDEDEGGKNLHEESFLADQLKRLGKGDKFSYTKITNYNYARKVADNLKDLMRNPFNVIVYNFVDMLSHARTEMEMIKELADDEKGYRSLTLSWFKNSPLLDILKQLADKKCKVVITTDHGTIRVQEPSKVIGDKNTNTNLRYKQGKNLDYNSKDVLEIKNPSDAFLPKIHVSSAYVFVKEDKFFAYPNNYNYYVNYYRNTFQHGGISLEEMLIPLVVLTAK
jgi:CheY-like chemotaxis protein